MLRSMLGCLVALVLLQGPAIAQNDQFVTTFSDSGPLVDFPATGLEGETVPGLDESLTGLSPEDWRRIITDPGTLMPGQTDPYAGLGGIQTITQYPGVIGPVTDTNGGVSRPPIIVGQEYVGLYNAYSGAAKVSVAIDGNVLKITLAPGEIRTLAAPGTSVVTATVSTALQLDFQMSLKRGAIYQILWDGNAARFIVAEARL